MGNTREIQVREKQEADAPVEYTRPGCVYTPSVDIFETEREITLLADMPGVTPEDVDIDLKENVLSITGDVKPAVGDGESEVFMEYETGKYFRRFSLSELIDQAKIEAKLENGVLRLLLPKAEKAVPRKITVNAG